ncbi:hypothetical protein SAMN05216215_102962 [Saccharopolyspora shandongensis]|uniref:Uncharacterized protein n=1 Tax=Saccharopolyspora shandongensis TaxID=418495 RepID=A0A1H3KWT6_9PSEU|nr:hypothetical protein SAMN05216215_102962 [Saccharopolyspora shandongensis]
MVGRLLVERAQPPDVRALEGSAVAIATPALVRIAQDGSADVVEASAGSRAAVSRPSSPVARCSSASAPRITPWL